MTDWWAGYWTGLASAMFSVACLVVCVRCLQ